MGNALESALQSILQLGSAPSDVVQVLQDQGTLGTQLMMILVFTAIGYAVLYHIIDSPSKNRKSHLWMTILTTASVTALTTLFYIPYSVNRGLQALNSATEMSIDGGVDVPSVVASTFPVISAVPTAISAFTLTVILFAVVVQLPWPRRLSVNCRSLRVI
ncbi:MAG: hypothetical protein FGM32_09080 [Candidatus Kapabacteria bacterium]|nr:hypothetical protein [Candidatus Kapabacteria bacterium]